MSKPIIFITGNANKFEEFKTILGKNFPREVESIKVNLREEQGEIEEICVAKCRAAADMVQGPVIIEDTCLCFNAMKGLPGPYIKWFVEKLGPEGLYKMLGPWEDKTAEVICTFGYCDGGPEDPVLLFHDITKGTIVSPRGPQDFGWDACFQPLGSDKTYAELSKEVKNQTSHRTRALEKLKEHLMKNVKY